jgi:hypothetical protein
VVHPVDQEQIDRRRSSEKDDKLHQAARSSMQHEMAENYEPQNHAERTQEGEGHLQEPSLVWGQGGDEEQSEQEWQRENETRRGQRNQQSFCEAIKHVPDSSGDLSHRQAKYTE